MKRLLFWLGVIAVLAALGAFVVIFWLLPLFGVRPGLVPRIILGIVIALVVISGWLADRRMRRRGKRMLGSESTDKDLVSIEAWMRLDERMHSKHGTPPPVPSDLDRQVTVALEVADILDEAQIDRVAETPEFTAPAASGLLFPSYPAPGVEIVPTTYRNVG